LWWVEAGAWEQTEGMDRGQGHWELVVCLLEEGREGWVEELEELEEQRGELSGQGIGEQTREGQET